MSEKSSRFGEWFFDYVIKENRSVAAIFSASNYRMEYLSPGAEDIVGVPRNELLTDVMKLLDMGKPTKKEIGSAKEILQSINPDDIRYFDELEVTNPTSGERNYFRGSLWRKNTDGRDRYILVWVDKTEEVKRNRQMEDMIAAANEANRAKTRFLANMSHDFRTPMNAITNFNLLIAKNSDDPQKVRDYTHKIELACQNLLILLNDVLDMSKIESGSTELSHEEFALGLLLEEVNSVVAFQAKSKHQEYIVNAEGVRQDIFIGDKHRINEVLTNILGNAVKYTPEGGRIEFDIREDRHGDSDFCDLTFTVKDNGIGISKEFQEKLFEPFTREEKAGTKGIQGSGLGMAITRNLVEMMGGTISVDSEEGNGSVFCIKLRFKGVSQEKDDFWDRHDIHRILVIDDDVEDCRKMETALKDTGVEVFFCTSGYKALHLITVGAEDGKGFDVILLGMQIRSISSFEVAERIRDKKLSPQPIMLLITDEWEEVAEKARTAGIYDFIQKPFFMSIFKQLIANIASRKTSAGRKGDEKPLQGMRFLAAEDNDINADILTELMGMVGAEVVRVADGQALIDKFTQSEPDEYNMILMDIQMPVMDGYDAAAGIRGLKREDARSIPIIAMTANAYADDVQRALDAGMNAHVAKPIDMKVLEATIIGLKKQISGRQSNV